MGAGQRVGTVQPGLVVAPDVGGPTAQEGIAAMQQAFKAGILNYDDILDGLTVKPARRQAEMGKLEAEIAKQKTDAQNRPLREEIDRLKMQAERADVGVAAGIAGARAAALTPEDIAEIGGRKAEADVLGSKKVLADIELDMREAHEKINDPEGLKAKYREIITKYEGNLSPGMTLDDLKNEAARVIKQAKQEKINFLQLEAQLKAAQEAGASIREQEGRLRTEMAARPEVKKFAEVYPFYQKVQSVVDLERTGGDAAVTAADDMSMIFSYMKILDPGSTVREGEYATAEGTRSWPESVRALYNKAWLGTKLTPEQRANFAAAAERNVAPHKQAYDQVLDQYRKLAQSYRVDPRNVAPPLEATTPPKPPGAAGWSALLPPPSGLGGAKKPTSDVALKPKTDAALAPGEHWYRLKDGRVVRGILGPPGPDGKPTLRILGQ